MQFAKPEYFLYLWIIPAVLAIYILSRKLWEKRMSRLIREKSLLSKLLGGYRNSEWILSAFLMVLVFLFMVLSLARPQWGDEKKSLQRKGVDIIFMVDTSLSMLAEDIKPNRLGKAKFEIESFIRNLRGDRIGMVSFAGSAFLQTPLTLDHAAFLLFLDAVQVGFLPDPGTSLSQSIHMAIQAFPQKELKYKALILFTDGEDQEGNIEQAIDEAKRANVRIYAIGLGTAEGEPIPLKNDKGERGGFKKDRSGQMVLTKLNQPLLERIAKETGGIYLPGTPGEKEIDLILKHLRGWGEQQFSEKVVVEKEEQYQTFLVIALILLVSEMFIRRRNRKGAALLSCLFAFFFFTGFFETSQETVKKGNDHFQNKRYQSALESYRKVQIKNPDSPEVLYDLGTTLYKVNAFQESAKDFETATAKIQDPKLKALALYNYGNTQYRLGNFEKAIESYKKALEINPDDKDAKYNLEFLQKSKSKIDKKDQQRKNENQKNQNQQQQQNQQQNQQNQQNKQDQQQGGQGQQDKQNQGQGHQDQPKDQKDQNKGQNQDQQSGQQDQQKQDQKQQQGQQTQQDQGQGQKDQKDQQQSKGQQGQDEQKDQRDQQKNQQQQDLQKEQEPKQPQQDQQKEQGQQPDQQKKDQEQHQGQQTKPLQGQMSKENAMNLLDALKESEKELQDLRKPPVNKNPPPVEKDW